MSAQPQNKKVSLTKNVTFLHKSHGEWNKIENPTVVPMNYERLDNDEEEIKMVFAHNEDNNNYINMGCDLESDDEVKE